MTDVVTAGPVRAAPPCRPRRFWWESSSGREPMRTQRNPCAKHRNSHRSMTFPAAPTASVTFIGNATTLLKFGPITLLTDPNFLHRGQHAYLGYGLTTRRLTEPALTIEELPALDGIVLSHLHGDHWDRVARRGLDHDLPVLTTPHASRRLQWRGFPRATGLRTWTAHEFIRDGYRVRLTALPGRHAPGVLRALLPPVMGSMLEFAPSGGSAVLRLYISGDTLLVDELRDSRAFRPHRRGVAAPRWHDAAGRIDGDHGRSPGRGSVRTVAGEDGDADSPQRLPAVRLPARRLHRRDAASRAREPGDVHAARSRNPTAIDESASSQKVTNAPPTRAE